MATVGQAAGLVSAFNLGSGGPRRTGGDGNQVNSDGCQTMYLWEQVWEREAWLDLLASFAHAVNIAMAR